MIQVLLQLRGIEVYEGWLIQVKKPTSTGLLFLQNGQPDPPCRIVSVDLTSLITAPAARVSAPVVDMVIPTGQLATRRSYNPKGSTHFLIAMDDIQTNGIQWASGQR